MMITSSTEHEGVSVEVVVVITRVEGVDLGQLFFTCLEERLLKLGIVPLNCILVCDCKEKRSL